MPTPLNEYDNALDGELIFAIVPKIYVPIGLVITEVTSTLYVIINDIIGLELGKNKGERIGARKIYIDVSK